MVWYADLPCKTLVIYAGNVQVCFAAVDSRIGWWSVVAKGFIEAADFSPPAQGFQRCPWQAKQG